jgi:hypothetical protein
VNGFVDEGGRMGLFLPATTPNAYLCFFFVKKNGLNLVSVFQPI